ncbi:MAG: hypothetical protein E6R04_08600 [Spirochaetes bacterium]|jgi:hypothetical protein|nr:MAG: hypothetical protein E6R04_08600 [Spirochaetota bacterium]
MPTVDELNAKIEDAEAALEALRVEAANTTQDRESDPIGYLAKLIFANKASGGAYGYDYGVLGDKERERAQEVLDMVCGFVNIAENVIVKLRVR